MKIWISVFLAFVFSSAFAQEKEPFVITPMDGVYSSWRNLTANQPMNTMGVEKVALNKKLKKRKDFSICKLRYEVNKQLLSTPYAVVIEGEIYINSVVVHSNQNKTESVYNLSLPNHYFHVASQGRFWYLLGLINANNNGVVVGALLGGVVGSLVGTAIAYEKDRGYIGIVYDPELRTYSSIKNCDELQKFAYHHETGKNYPCIGQKFTHHQVRQFIFKLNNTASDN